MATKRHILGVGLAVLDIVHVVDHYPREDDKVSAASQHLVRGGNVANSLVVLSQLGHDCSWAGVLGTGPLNGLIEKDLGNHGVDTQWCRRGPHEAPPLSCITVARDQGTRTIVHYRDQREFGPDDLARVELDRYDWIHFEGRHVDEATRMLSLVRRQAPQARISLEVERPYPGIEALFELPDVLFLSRTYAEGKGYSDGLACLRNLGQHPHADLMVCAWGTRGAVATDGRGEEYRAPAYPPSHVVDTRAAGDVFNAGFINASLRQGDVGTILDEACRLAGRKCGAWGLNLDRFPGEGGAETAPAQPRERRCN
jgi:ketohexokinase